MFADLALPPTIPFLNWAWDDLLFLILAGIMLGCGAVRRARPQHRPLRPGDDGLPSPRWPASMRWPAPSIVAATQVLVYIGAISILILFAIMLTQTKCGPD